MRLIKIKLSKSKFGCKPKHGLGLLEVVVSIGMIFAFFAVIAAVSYSLRAFQENRFRMAASYIVRASMDKIRSLPFAALTFRSNAPLAGITFNIGNWKTAADPDAPSAPNVLYLQKSGLLIGDTKALISAPATNVENGSIEAKIKLNSSPQNSLAGIFFRSQDNHNYYRFIFNADAIKLEKVENGAPSVLWQQTRSFATSSFYTLKVSLASSNITLSLDGFVLTLPPLSDSTFGKGDVGFVVIGDILPSIDDVSIISGLSFNWNFDNVGPPDLPITWERASLYDLPQGQGFLTVEDIASGIKKVIIKLNWTTHFGLKTLEEQTYITSY